MNKITVIDGGLSTELERLGVRVTGNLWTGHTLLDDPAAIEQAHKNYAQSGAEVVITSSYQLSRKGFEEIGLSSVEADLALQKSVEVARAAVVGTGARVAASVGPYGAVLHDGSEYRGIYEVGQSELEDFHFERLQTLVAASPDLLAVETIPNIVEARAIANVLREIDLPKWVSFTAGSAEKLWSGEWYADAVATLAGLDNLIAIGVNCVSPELVTNLATIANATTDVPFIAYPNRGGAWDSTNGIWIGAEPAQLTTYLPEWIDAGVNFVGGCCGTDATDIAKLAATLSQ